MNKTLLSVLFLYAKIERSIMQVLQRLKLELSNQEYFSDSEYTQFLNENNLDATDEYIKSDMQRPLL